MRSEKPDTTRQSEGFDQVHTGLTVGQIAVPRRDLRTFTATDRESEVLARNCDPVFDYLPVEDTAGHVIGLLSNDAISTAGGDGGNARVVERMDPLSKADLIGAGAPIVALIDRIRRKPFLVVSGQEIIGMVTWSDLQKLPVRAALFSLVTGFELTMYEAIRRHFDKRDDWIEHVDECRLCMAKREYRSQQERGGDVDLLLCTQFCDKRDILIGSFDFAVGKKKLRKKFRAIERIRNDVAHANNYAMTFKEAKKLRATLRHLVALRSRINSFAR